MKLLAILFFVLAVFPIISQAQSLFDVKEKYLDYQGVQHDFTNENLAKYPLYQVSENQNNYTITRFGDSVYLPKRPWIEYIFYPERIVPRYRIDSYTQINSLVTKVNTSVWYLTVPFSASQYRSITDDLIDMGVFKRTTKISVSDSNFTCGEDCPAYAVVPKVIGNDIRFYFNSQQYSTVVYPLYLTENTITVDNSTTAGFTTANISTNGYWSAFSGGSIGTPLNSSIHANLSGYWDMESTSGTIEYGINKYGYFPNSSIQGTWNGNTTLNYTLSGIGWGNALDCSGTDDYVSVSNIPDFGTNPFAISFQFKPRVISLVQAIVSKGKWSSGFEVNFYSTNKIRWQGGGVTTLYSTSILSSGTWYSVNIPRNNTNYTSIYINNIYESNATVSGTLSSPTKLFNICRESYTPTSYTNGSVDEVIIDSSGNPIFSNSTYATSWNLTIWNNTADSGKVINQVKFNISNLNVQNSTANISMRQNGTTNWTLINSTYVTDTWINQTMFSNTDFLIEVYGNGSSRAFIVSGEIETHGNVTLNGTVSNILGAPIHDVLVTWDDSSVFTNESGYYELLNVSTGPYDLLTQQIGYDSNTTTLTLTGDTTINITLQEKEHSEVSMPGFEGIGILFIFGMIYYYKKLRK